MLRDRLDAIVSGVIRGVAIPKEHRRQSLWLLYFLRIAGAAGGQIGLGFCWLVAANAASEDDVKLLCYFCAWITLMGVIAWIVSGILAHRHLAPLLREAEAD